MKKISAIEELRESIFLLESQQANDLQLLQEQFKTTAENLRPANLLKNTFKDLTALPDLKGNLLDTSIGLAAGYLSKKVIVGATHNPIKKLLGAVLQLGVTSFVSKHPEGIKSVAQNLINTISPKNDTPA
jgi:hypothetical protein